MRGAVLCGVSGQHNNPNRVRNYGTVACEEGQWCEYVQWHVRGSGVSVCSGVRGQWYEGQWCEGQCCVVCQGHIITLTGYAITVQCRVRRGSGVCSGVWRVRDSGV